jgi:hypothetical protein
MQPSVNERVVKMRLEIAEIDSANQDFTRGIRKEPWAMAEQERRIQRLEEILGDVRSLAAWKKT